MIVDINIDEKTLDTNAAFELSVLKGEKACKTAIAIITMLAADYSLDPEIEVEELQEMVKTGVEMNHVKLNFIISEDGIEAEFSK